MVSKLRLNTTRNNATRGFIQCLLPDYGMEPRKSTVEQEMTFLYPYCPLIIICLRNKNQ